MRALFLIISIMTTTACAARVHLSIPASPAVVLPERAVSVVARDRGCQSVADTLVAALRESDSLHVLPTAKTRLEVFGCGDDQSWTLQEIVRSDEQRVRRRTLVAARAHAVVAVTHHGRVLAHLLGAGRAHYDSSWQPTRWLSIRNTARRHATHDLVDDLETQLDPMPTFVQRRVYPNAAEGSARALTTRAVRAEQSGDVLEALRWARAAWERQPTTRTAGYVVELRRRVPSAPMASSE
ncbi:MAG: hypothetical protein KTR31_00745 [Myxococcales bacterium]|nr:hypothetical protein [Myxococcales bacterium]